MTANIQLTDGFVTLRPPSAEDLPALLTAVHASLAELGPWMGWATPAYNEASARNWLEHVTLAWEHGSGFHFAITDAASGEYLGQCGVDGINPQERLCNLGYWVRTGRTGRGFASRAARLAARYAFETGGLIRAEIVIAAGNLPSQRAAQKAGAHYVDRFPNRLVVRTEVHDAVVYALTPADFGLPTV